MKRHDYHIQRCPSCGAELDIYDELATYGMEAEDEERNFFPCTKCGEWLTTAMSCGEFDELEKRSDYYSVDDD